MFLPATAVFATSEMNAWDAPPLLELCRTYRTPSMSTVAPAPTSSITFPVWPDADVVMLFLFGCGSQTVQLALWAFS